MTTPAPTDEFRLLTLNESLISELTPRQCRDAIQYLDPDLICLAGGELTDPYLPVEIPVLKPVPGQELRLRKRRVLVSSPQEIQPTEELGTEQLIYLLRSEFRDQPGPGEIRGTVSTLPDDAVVLFLDHPAGTSISARPPTEKQRLAGIGCPVDDETTYAPLTLIEPSGHVYLEERLSRFRLGVRAIKGIGRSKGETLQNEGYDTRSSLVETEPESLLELDGFGPYYASIAHGGAHAHEHDEPIWFADNPVSDRKVAYVDIETDAGVSVIWQIGVYDEPTDSYKYFIETRQKNDPRPVPRSFARWVYEEAPDRTFLAWYGSGFDFPHLSRFIDRFAEVHHAECWDDVGKVDLLQDIVRARSAVPSRSHKVDIVAGRLGYDRGHGGLTGADAARTYQQWLEGVEPDWDSWIEYCRDDVIGMKHILDRLREAPKLFDKEQLN